MMKYLTRMIICLTALWIGGCNHSPQTNDLFKEQKIIPISRFASLQAKGPFELTIILGADQNQIQVTAPSNVIHRLHYKLDNNKLTLHVFSFYANHYPLQVTLSTTSNYLKQADLINLLSANINPTGKGTIDSLNVNRVQQTCLCGSLAFQNLTVSGKGALSGKGDISVSSLVNRGEGSVYLETVHSPQMVIKNLDAGKITLRGYVHVDQIYQAGSGQTTLYWLNSDKTRITVVQQGKVVIAGKSQKLVAEVLGSAFLDAKYLRAHTVYTHTYQNALAYVNAEKFLFVSAKDTSQINYYENPAHLYRYTDQQGVILPLF